MLVIFLAAVFVVSSLFWPRKEDSHLPLRTTDADTKEMDEAKRREARKKADAERARLAALDEESRRAVWKSFERETERKRQAEERKRLHLIAETNLKRLVASGVRAGDINRIAVAYAFLEKVNKAVNKGSMTNKTAREMEEQRKADNVIFFGALGPGPLADVLDVAGRYIPGGSGYTLRESYDMFLKCLTEGNQ
ncbi:MAG: hypothetical protein U0793_03410 [Gemmataceae bacterium]